MKARILTIGAALLALTSVSLAQTHHKSIWTKHPTKTYTIRHRGGKQTVTYTTAQQRHDAKYARYSKSEWERKIREARERRKHRKGQSWSQAVKNRKHHSKTWYEAVKHRKHKTTRHTTVWHRPVMHRGAGHETVWTGTRHDNGKHLGWYKGKGNPHRTGNWKGKGHDKDHDNDRDRDRKHKDKDHDGDHDKKGHGH